MVYYISIVEYWKLYVYINLVMVLADIVMSDAVSGSFGARISLDYA